MYPLYIFPSEGDLSNLILLIYWYFGTIGIIKRHSLRFFEWSWVLTFKDRKLLQHPNYHIRYFCLGHLLPHATSWAWSERHKESATGRLQYLPPFGPKLGPVLAVISLASIKWVGTPDNSSPCSDEDGALAVWTTTVGKRRVSRRLSRMWYYRRVQAESYTRINIVSLIYRFNYSPSNNTKRRKLSPPRSCLVGGLPFR